MLEFVPTAVVAEPAHQCTLKNLRERKVPLSREKIHEFLWELTKSFAFGTTLTWG